MKKTFKYYYRPKLVVTKKNGLMRVTTIDRRPIFMHERIEDSFDTNMTRKEYLEDKIFLKNTHGVKAELVWSKKEKRLYLSHLYWSGWIDIDHCQTYEDAKQFAIDIASKNKNFEVER